MTSMCLILINVDQNTFLKDEVECKVLNKLNFIDYSEVKTLFNTNEK